MGLFLASHLRKMIRISKVVGILRAKIDKDIFEFIFRVITFMFQEDISRKIRIIKLSCLIAR